MNNNMIVNITFNEHKDYQRIELQSVIMVQTIGNKLVVLINSPYVCQQLCTFDMEDIESYTVLKYKKEK